MIDDLKRRIKTEWARLDRAIVTASVASSLVAFRVCHGLYIHLYSSKYDRKNLAITTIFLTVVDYHVTNILASFHWLRAPERINFKLAVLVYRSLHGTAPRYLSDFLRRVADLPSRCRLRSATSNQLDVRPSRLVTVGDRSFGSVGPKLWNSLSDDITSASSLSVFRNKLKTHLFQQSYP